MTVRTNLCTNPSLESGTTGWGSTSTFWTNSSSIAQSSAWAAVGSQSLACTTPGTHSLEGCWFRVTAGLAANTTYTISATVRSVSGRPITLHLRDETNGVSGTASAAVSPGQAFRVSATITTGASTPTSLLIAFGGDSTIAVSSFNVDALLVEQGGSLGSYFDGSLGSDGQYVYAWTGTANASTSTATTIQRPSLTLTVTPPGGGAVDYSRYLAYDGTQQQIQIAQNFGRQGDTAVIPLVDEYDTTPNIGHIAPMSQVRLVDNNLGGKVLFAGLVTDPALVVTGPNRNEWVLNCTDYTFYADKATVRGIFTGARVDDMVVSLTEQANCGITAAETSAGGFVAPGPQIARASFGWKSLSDAWRTLATLAGSVVPFGWYVDENLALHFFDQTRAPSSGVTFTTTPTTGLSTTEGHFALDSSFQYEWDATSLVNRVLVQGATQTISASTAGPATDVFYGDGVTTAWAMRGTMAGAGPLKLTINGVPEVVGVANSGATWITAKNANGQWFLSTASAPPAGSTILLWYDAQQPVIAQVNDYASQSTYNGPNGGVFSAYISDSSLTTAPMALARAQQERTEYAFAVERITFNTTEDWIGWVRSGDLITVDCLFIPDSRRSYARGVTDTFLVIQNQVQFGQGGYRTMQITAVRL